MIALLIIVGALAFAPYALAWLFASAYMSGLQDNGGRQ